MNGTEPAFPTENGSCAKGFTKQQWVLLEMTKALIAGGYDNAKLSGAGHCRPSIILDKAADLTNEFFGRL